jgi:hypothetical protein
VMVAARRVAWRVLHAPVEAVSIVVDAVSTELNRLATGLYNKAWPDESGGIQISISSNRQGQPNQVFAERMIEGFQQIERTRNGREARLFIEDIDGPLYGPDGPVNW